MATPRLDPAMLELIQTEARKQAEAVYDEMGTKYGVASVPTHVHNGVDSNTLPQFVPASNGLSGVLGPLSTPGQVVNLNPVTNKGNSNVFSVPIPIIYGHGVGTASQFNGGDAPDGTMIIFMNDPVVKQLWFRAVGTVPGVSSWYGIDVTKGPIA